MFFNTNRLFTIGQFAKLHGINKKTLMWYDETGLLKPAIVRENGYRYYTYQQSSTLEIILMLRELSISISDIQKFLENRSPSTLEGLFAEKISEVDEMISHLVTIRKNLSDRRQDMITLSDLDLSEIQIISKQEPHSFAVVDISQGLSFEEELERVVAEAKKYQLRRLHDASYGAIIPVENLYRGDFGGYSELYIDLPFPARAEGVHIQPGGKYLRAFCKGAWDRLPDRYREILNFAERNGLRLSGHAYEKGINEIVIDTLDDYITQIEIPILAE